MSDGFKFGDLLRYTIDQDPDRHFLFVYVGHWGGYHRAAFLQPFDDDVWSPGDVIPIGSEEMELAKEVLTHEGIREFQDIDGKVYRA